MHVLRTRARCATTLVCLALLAGAGASCAAPGAAAWNLRQVHRDDGGASYQGDLRTDFEARVLASGEIGAVGGQRLPSVASLFGLESALEERQEPIADPGRVALKNARKLAGFDPEDARVRALQAELFGWLAADSVFPLVRERATLALGRVGRLLSLTEPVHLPADATPAGPGELAGALRPLIAAAGGSGDLTAACADVRALVLDRAGLRRAVAVLTILRFGRHAGNALQRSRAARADAPELVALHDELQRALVAQALAAALDDPNPRVRAAGVEASVVATNNALPGLLQGAILQGSSEEVIVRALDLLEQRGIPTWEAGRPSEERALYERSWISLLVGLLRQVGDGPIAIAACQALGKISASGLSSLRPEDWLGWWSEVGADLDPTTRG